MYFFIVYFILLGSVNLIVFYFEKTFKEVSEKEGVKSNMSEVSVVLSPTYLKAPS